MNFQKRIRKSPTVLPDAGELNAMIRKGMTPTEIASIYGVAASAICVKLRRSGFAPTKEYDGIRVINKRPPDVSAIMERYPAPAEVKHADRVTRVTMSGAVVTVRRLTFLDGPFIDGSAP